MIKQAEITCEISKDCIASLFEGGAGSGHYGHKGRPGKRGGSLPGGGGAGGTAAHKISGKAGGEALRGMKKGDIIRITNPVTGWKSTHSADKLKPSKSIKGGVIITSKEKTLSGLVGMPMTHTLIIKPQDKVEIFRGGKKVGTSKGSGDAKTYYGISAGAAKGISAHKVGAGAGWQKLGKTFAPGKDSFHKKFDNGMNAFVEKNRKTGSVNVYVSKGDISPAMRFGSGTASSVSQGIRMATEYAKKGSASGMKTTDKSKEAAQWHPRKSAGFWGKELGGSKYATVQKVGDKYNYWVKGVGLNKDKTLVRGSETSLGGAQAKVDSFLKSSK